MHLIVFSRFGIHYESADSGSAHAIYIPSNDQTRTLGDVEHNAAAINERLGYKNPPLWREERGQVVVYGQIPEDLKERRHSLNAYLPQDFVPEDCTAFYFVFGEKWLVHGVKSANDANELDWGVSRMEITGDETPEETITKIVSEQLLESGEGRVVIAIEGSANLEAKLNESLKAYGLNVVPFGALTPEKSVQPIYKHSDGSLIMFTLGFFAILVVCAICYYWYSNVLQVKKSEGQIRQVTREISSIQVNERIGNIRQPERVLELMKKPMRLEPSKVLHAAAEVGAEFGTVRSVSYGVASDVVGKPDSDQIVMTKIELENFNNELLVDQETLAKKVIDDHPWVRVIERKSNQNQLDVEIQSDLPVGKR